MAPAETIWKIHFSPKWPKWSESRLVMSNSLLPHYYTVHGILQAKILEWVPFPIFGGSSQPRDRTQVSHIAGWFTKYFAILIVNLASIKIKNVLKLFAEFINIKRDYHFPLCSVNNWERCIEIFYCSGRFIYLSLQFC